MLNVITSEIRLLLRYCVNMKRRSINNKFINFVFYFTLFTIIIYIFKYRTVKIHF